MFQLDRQQRLDSREISFQTPVYQYQLKNWKQEVLPEVKQKLLDEISLLHRKEYEFGLSKEEINCRGSKRGEL